MLIEQIIKEAETFTDVFQLFAQYPEYKVLFAKNYAKVRNMDKFGDEASIVGQAQEMTSQELTKKNIKLITNKQSGRDIVDTLRSDKSLSDLRNELNDITASAQARQEKNMGQITQKSGADNQYSDRFYGNQYTGSLGRGAEKTIRDRLAGDTIRSLKSIKDLAFDQENPTAMQGYNLGKDLANSLGSDFQRLPGSNLARALMRSGDSRLKSRPSYSK